MEPTLPRLEDHLPDLLDHVRALAAEIAGGQLQRGFFNDTATPEFYTT